MSLHMAFRAAGRYEGLCTSHFGFLLSDAEDWVFDGSERLPAMVLHWVFGFSVFTLRGPWEFKPGAMGSKGPALVMRGGFGGYVDVSRKLSITRPTDRSVTEEAARNRRLAALDRRTDVKVFRLLISHPHSVTEAALINNQVCQAPPTDTDTITRN